ncbi:molybdopterin-guanine dinucleotide biosynthesis protein MobC [Allgaiera indica]|uniref:Molybdopterin-guanine dinucleotide biosynthesis protein MobC n=2 Tax=Allgaiera indica TaxID=765699 RepID=A0AAN4UPI7_9RHOB|nr:molybdopterin-guanine dinucleotide biosynthesis protein MobC [Allgaiera indica]SDW35805.1 Ribosomal protein S18 acetylase RimI [Allgaiera indica]
MHDMAEIYIRRGLASAHRAEAARLYWQAFAPKLGRVMGPEDLALTYLARVMRADQALCAIGTNGVLLGLAGFRTRAGAFAHGNRHDMAAIYGPFGAIWRIAAWRLLGPEREPWFFQIEGLCVREEARGCGVGSALVEAACAEARARGHSEVRLDVSDDNLRARALYERAGFTATGGERLGARAVLFGYREATRMVRRLG